MPRPRMKVLKPGRTEAQNLAAGLQTFQLYGVDIDRQNTAGFYNPKGRYVACGKPGNSDLTGMIPARVEWGPAGGKKIDVEVKAEGFDPRKLRGEKREHFDRQLARLVKTNENGGFGFWYDDPLQVIHVLERIKEGWRIVFVDDFPFLTDEV